MAAKDGNEVNAALELIGPIHLKGTLVSADALHCNRLGEDAARNRKDNGPANIAVIRRRMLDVARLNQSKGSLTVGIEFELPALAVRERRREAL